MGGGFGRRSVGDYAVECARIAKEVRRPVKLIWTREEDIAQGMFRPQSFQCLEAATDASGKVTGWKHCVVGDGGCCCSPRHQHRPITTCPTSSSSGAACRTASGSSTGARSAHVFNMFAIESFVDQMAVDANMDPIEFRFQRMVDHAEGAQVLRDRRADVRLEGAASRTAARSASRSPSARARSAPAWSRSRSTAQTGKIRVHKVWVAVDGGIIVHARRRPRPTSRAPSSTASRAMLHERVTLKDGAVEQTNFHDYNLMRMSDLPEEMHVAVRRRGHAADRPRRDRQSVHRRRDLQRVLRLTGKRLRHMPFTPERVLEALKA